MASLAHLGTERLAVDHIGTAGVVSVLFLSSEFAVLLLLPSEHQFVASGTIFSFPFHHTTFLCAFKNPKSACADALGSLLPTKDRHFAKPN